MGFYLRKSISVGPLRFNLSKSGVGVSAGFKGFRIGAGPRGNYVHMGRGGLYYRATLPPLNSPRANASNKPSDVPVAPDIPSGTHDPLKEIESADVSQIVDSSSRELLDELNQKRKKMRLWPAAATFSLVALGMGSSNDWPNWALGLVVFIGVIGTYITHTRDALAKTVVLFYDFDDELEKAYGEFHSAAEKLAKCASAWHISASGKVHDSKYHAGANALVNRKTTTINKAEPPYVKTNIETIAIGVGRQTLHFFPDRVLVYDTNGVGAVGYKDLVVNVSDSRFIESETVPRDAKVVDRTWRYVNKSGGPDKRFKDNKELPICLYEEIEFKSSSGLNELIQVSQNGVGTAFSKAIVELGNKVPKETVHPAT